MSRDDDLEVEHEEYDNGNDEDQKVTLNKETTKSKVLTKFDKIVATGSGGIKGNTSIYNLRKVSHYHSKNGGYPWLSG